MMLQTDLSKQYMLNPSNTKCQEWYSPSLGVECPILVCRGERVKDYSLIQAPLHYQNGLCHL